MPRRKRSRLKVLTLFSILVGSAIAYLSIETPVKQTVLANQRHLVSSANSSLSKLFSTDYKELPQVKIHSDPQKKATNDSSFASNRSTLTNEPKRSRQPASAGDPSTILNSRKHKGEWVKRLETDGTETISGGIDLQPITTVGEAESLLRELSTSQSDQSKWTLIEEKTKIEGPHHDQVYHWDQRYDNLIVFNGYTRLFTRGEDSSAYFIVKNEQVITSNNLDRTIRISASEAKMMAMGKVNDVDEIDVDVEPQIFVHQDKTSELAWNLTVRYNSHQKRRMLIGASTGAILYNESLVYF